MHASDALGDVGENVQDFGLGQTVLQSRVHEVDQPGPVTVFHQQENLVTPTLQL